MDVLTLFLLLFCFSQSFFFITTTTASDTINTTQFIRDGDTIVSAGGTFELGFFSPHGSSSSNNPRYLGIWYAEIPVRTVVWVANRETPLNDSSGVLTISQNGILVILNQDGIRIWSSNTSRPARNPVAQILDSGNLVVKDGGGGGDPSENFLWQSFDYPGDTFLPGMKAGKNFKTGIDWNIQSWKSPDDPSPGNFTFQLDLDGYPEFFVKKNSVSQFRFGPWNGLRFTGAITLTQTDIYTFGFVLNKDEIYLMYQIRNYELPMRVVLNYDGRIQGYAWPERKALGWVPFHSVQLDDCDNYAQCGVYSSCNVTNAPICSCLKGFVPKNRTEMDVIGWSNGCVRRTPLNCSGDGFQRYSEVKFPDTGKSWFNESMNLQECEVKCKKNCSCTAYANLNISNGGSGCLLWFDDLIDIRTFYQNVQDQVIYIRMAASEIVVSSSSQPKTDALPPDNGENSQRSAKNRSRIIIVCVLSSFLLLGLLMILYFRKKKQQKVEMTSIVETSSNNKKSQQEDLELPLFDFDMIASATDNFSNCNKLGEGGFGPVYKGRLKDDLEIAVKRLSKSSRQGLEEFKNEVMYIAKLQHRNLVKLLGCCIEGDEKMLIYEFMPNKSLDVFIFDETLSKQLNWPTHYNIINGIARGLLYLHQDSRLKIIHRDLKASNVLLDFEMNSKISDFGLARSFGINESHANTNKVVGTYGYMSPEYAIDGHYSVKSDVFSFGVLLLEIVSGKRNRGFRHPEHNLNLLGHAWKLHKEGRYSELISESMIDSYDKSEVLRLIHIGLLCVQRSPEDRPSMSSVIVMLAGDGALSEPKEPGFFAEREIIEDNSSSSSNHKHCSANNLTITILEAR